jgi:O-antigen ligase
MSIIRWFLYGLFFLGMIQVLNSRRRIEITVFVILTLCVFSALYGIMETFSGSEHIWWYQKTRNIGLVTGTYDNPNHFAGLMEMGLLLVVPFAAGLTGKKNKSKPRRKRSLNVWISHSLSVEQGLPKRMLILFAGVVMGVGLVLSASRGGILSATCGLFVVGILFVLKKGHRRKGFIALSVFVIISLYAFQIGIEESTKKFKSFWDSMDRRHRLTQTTFEMFEDYRLTGVGVGNFRYVYPKYQDKYDKGWLVDHAHNDWVQFLSEAGMVGFGLFLIGISYYFYRTVTLWRKRKDPFAIGCGIAAYAAMTTMAIHSYSDYNLHRPGNVLILLSVIGIGYSALHLGKRGHGERSFLRYRNMPLYYRGILFLLPIAGLMAWSGTWTVRHFVAEAYCNTVLNYTLNRDQNPPLSDLRKALAWDRGNAAYWWKMARELIRIRNDRKKTQGARRMAHEEGMVAGFRDKKELQLEIIHALEEAIRLNPFRREYHVELGWEYVQMWFLEPDQDEKWLSSSDKAMERAAYFAGESHPYLHILIGNYWVMRSKIWPSSSSERKRVWAKARWHYKMNLSLETGYIRRRMEREIKKTILAHYPEETYIKQVFEDERVTSKE